MLKSILEFYTKYFAWSIIVSSFLAVTYGLIYIDLDSIYYIECNESLANSWHDSPVNFLGLSNLKLSILLVVFSFVLFLTVSSYFDFIKKASVVIVSSLLMKLWITFYTSGTLILNLGFIKIFRGMTLAEKQAFINSLKDNMIQYFEELPLEIQKIINPEIFKETTLSYLNNLKNVIPNVKVATEDILSTFGYYLWDNKVSIIFGILNILVISLLNNKINSVNNNLKTYTNNSDNVNTNLAESITSLNAACNANTNALASTNVAVMDVQVSIDTIGKSLLAKLNSLNVLNDDNLINFSLINFILILLKISIIIKKKVYKLC